VSGKGLFLELHLKALEKLAGDKCIGR